MSMLSRRDKLIPWYFVAFFVVLVIVDGAMVTLAVTTYRGTVIDHPYEQGLSYNSTIAAYNSQESLHWQSDSDYTSTGPLSGVLNFTLRDAQGKAIAALVSADIVRPVQAGLDFSSILKPSPGGVYSTNVTFPAPGQWEVRFYAVSGSTTYQSIQRMVVE